MCMGAMPPCVSVLRLCVVCSDARREHWAPWTGGMDAIWMLRLELGPLEEQPVLLTTEPPLQPLGAFLRVEDVWSASHGSKTHSLLNAHSPVVKHMDTYSSLTARDLDCHYALSISFTIPSSGGRGGTKCTMYYNAKNIIYCLIKYI